MFQEGISLLESIYNLSAIFTAVSVTVIGIFVFYKDPKSPVNRSYTLFLISYALWSYALFFCQMSANNREMALFWNRLLHTGATLIPVTFLAYILITLKQFSQKRHLFLGIILYTLVLIGFDLLTPLVIKGMTPKWYFRLWPVPGPLYPFFLLLFFSCFGYSVILVYQAFRKASGNHRTQLKYILLAILIGASGGSTNYFLFYNIHVHPLANWFCFFYSIIIAYAIIRYKLFEIDTVVHRTILWLFTISILILPVGLAYGLFRHQLRALSPLAVTAILSATLLVFLAYYNKAKPWIDHLFRRRKYDYQLMLAELPSRIGSSLDLKLLSQNLFRELKGILYVRNAMLLIRPLEKDTFEKIDSMGYDLSSPNEATRIKSLSLPASHPLVQWLAARQKVLEKEQVEIDPQYASIREEALELFNRNSLELLIPLTMQEQLISVLGLGKKENLQAYRIKDLELLEHIGKQIGITIDNALHHGDIVEKERIAEELRLGRQIQTSLLPQHPPKIAHLFLQGIMQPAKEIGGDYYDFINLPEQNKLGIVIGDVSGKGVAAGLLMAMVKTAIHIFSSREASPKEILIQVNEILDRHIGGEKFMTMLYLVWQSDRTALKYSSAGHEHILIYRQKKDDVEAIMSGGIILGVMPDIRKYLEEKEIELEVGDKVLLYTDGVTEAHNAEKDRFGLERLMGTFRRNGGKSVEEIIEAVKDDVFKFIGNYPQYDDMTLVAIEAGA